MFNYTINCHTCGNDTFVLQASSNEASTIHIYCPTCDQKIACFSSYALHQLESSTEEEEEAADEDPNTSD